MKRIYVVGTADTKGEELAFLADAIAATGAAVSRVDVGTRDATIPVDISANDIAGHISTSLAPVVAGGGNYWNATFFNPADGQQATEHWDGKDRRAIYVYERPARATLVQVDPGEVLLLDINRTNNSWTAQPRGREATRKWSLAWMVWLQELMITSGFFA